MMAEYVVVRLDPTHIQVTKFDGGDQPKAIYSVQETPEMLICNCPRWLKRKTTFCRHTDIVEDWKQSGEPVPYTFTEKDKC